MITSGRKERYTRIRRKRRRRGTEGECKGSGERVRIGKAENGASS